MKLAEKLLESGPIIIKKDTAEEERLNKLWATRYLEKASKALEAVKDFLDDDSTFRFLDKSDYKMLADTKQLISLTVQQVRLDTLHGKVKFEDTKIPKIVRERENK